MSLTSLGWIIFYAGVQGMLTEGPGWLYWTESELAPFIIILPLTTTFSVCFRCSDMILPMGTMSSNVIIQNGPRVIFQECRNPPQLSNYALRLLLMEMLKNSFWFSSLFKSAQKIGFPETQGSLSNKRLLKPRFPCRSFYGKRQGGLENSQSLASHEEMLTNLWILLSCHQGRL